MKIIRGEKEKNSCFVESNYGLMLFDTGAASSQLFISPRTEALDKTETVTSYGLMGSVVQQTAIVDKLIVGEMTAENLKVTLDEDVGILGNDVLKNYAFKFDLKKDEITIVDRFTSDIPVYIGKRNHLYLKIAIKGIEHWALIDTGASCSLMDRTCYMELFGDAAKLKMDKGEDWTGESIETPIAVIDGLMIGTTLFPEHEVALVDFTKCFVSEEYPVAMIIGASTLAEKRFWFNMVDGYIKMD